MRETNEEICLFVFTGQSWNCGGAEMPSMTLEIPSIEFRKNLRVLIDAGYEHTECTSWQNLFNFQNSGNP